MLSLKKKRTSHCKMTFEIACLDTFSVMVICVGRLHYPSWMHNVHLFIIVIFLLLFSSLCHTMFEFAVEILRVMVHGLNPVHPVQCHQVSLIFVLLLYCYNIMPTTKRSVTNSLFIHVCTNCKAAALVLSWVINVSGNVSTNKKVWTTNLSSSTQR